MERNERGTRIIAIMALCVGIVGLSIGFAAFTRDLNIQFSESNVKVSGDLDVKLLASNNKEDTSMTVEGEVNGATSASVATIASDALTISGLGATFNNKGQSVEYTFYIYNNSEYDGYLKSVKFLDYIGSEVNKVCTAMEGTNQNLVDDACDDISLSINIAGETVINTDKSSFSSPKITKEDIVPVIVTINYDNSENSAVLPGGDFKINFGGIKLSYSSLED